MPNVPQFQTIYVDKCRARPLLAKEHNNISEEHFLNVFNELNELEDYIHFEIETTVKLT